MYGNGLWNISATLASNMRKSIEGGIHRDHEGRFWIRPTLNGKRTWRILASLTLSDARAEAAALLSDHARSKLGLTRDPFSPAPPTVSAAAATVARALPPRILSAFGSLSLSAVTPAAAQSYGATREATRAADIELSALSALLSESVRRGWIRQNPLLGRARFHSTIRHSREVMPADGDELHRLAAALLAVPQSRAIGWQLLFSALTGCRTGEVLALRMDARSRGDPGWIEGRYLYVRRTKGGVFPYVELTAELRACIEAHRVWHAQEGGGSRWWFPGADRFRPLERHALTAALRRVSERKVTAHGCRAYFATVWRSRGKSDEQIAAMIGDRTVALIQTTYGSLPESWAGGKELGWMPENGEVAWGRWTVEKPSNVIAI